MVGADSKTFRFLLLSERDKFRMEGTGFREP